MRDCNEFVEVFSRGAILSGHVEVAPRTLPVCNVMIAIETVTTQDMKCISIEHLVQEVVVIAVILRHGQRVEIAVIMVTTVTNKKRRRRR